MPAINPVLPTLGNLNLTEDPTTRNALLTLVNAINGQLDKDNLLDGGITADKLVAAALQAIGLNSTGVTRRGKAIVGGLESRTNTVYGLMSTPDRVPAVRVEQDGLLIVAYQAQWRESVALAARAALFLGATQLSVQAVNPATGPQAEAAVRSAGGPNQFAPLVSSPVGLVSASAGGDWLSDVPIQALGQFAPSESMDTGGTVFGTNITPGLLIVDNIPAGSYDVSVQFKASSGTVDVRSRRLKVWSVAFG